MKNVFLKAAIITVAVFLIGMYFGFVLDTMRVNDVRSSLTEIDNLWNDVRLTQTYIESFSNSTEYCNFLLNENLKMGDKIYAEGLQVQEYESANRFSSSFTDEKVRYALLDLQFWLNSIDLKSLCNGNYSTVIYFYSQYNKTPEQSFQDNVLWDLKQKCGSKIIYITFPADMNITALDVVQKTYNIQKLPAILINEKTLLYSPETVDEMEKYVSC